MDERNRKRARSRSPYRHGHSTKERPERERNVFSDERRPLPLNARELTKHDLSAYLPMFALYLDIQKQIDVDELPEDEVKGRWKSFVKKWNRGDLSRGWYDSETLQKARDAAKHSNHASRPNARRETPDRTRTDSVQPDLRPSSAGDGDEDDEDDFGPALPYDIVHPKGDLSGGTRPGPTIPRLDDIRSRNEDARLSMEETREQRLEAMKQTRNLERKEQKERLDEIAPRAEAGTRERQLEKRRDLAASNRAFATSKEVGGEVDIPESDVMGGDDLSDLKRKKQEDQRRKTEREIRRDEVLRARAAELEERTQRMREKEEKTMSMLRELARSRFGDGNEQPATLKDA